MGGSGSLGGDNSCGIFCKQTL
jgi:hypothetical protein